MFDVAGCYALAVAGNYTVFGLRNGGECWAGGNIASAVAGTKLSSDCTMQCTASPGSTCGGAAAFAVYSVTGSGSFSCPTEAAGTECPP